MKKGCEDFDLLGNFKVHGTPECAECKKTGDSWVHLRTCQTCGLTLCCDSSANKHMTDHFKKTGHPLVISAEPGEKWLYCYKHELFSPYP